MYYMIGRRLTVAACFEKGVSCDTSTHLAEGKSDGLTQFIELQRKEISAKTEILEVLPSNR